MKKLIFLIMVLSAVLTIHAQKKVEILPSTIQGVVGSQVIVPVVITGFNTDTTSLVAAEFYLNFDNTVLTFESVANVSDLMPQEEWFFSNPDPTLNRFSCNWVEPTFVTNVSVPDGTTLFEIVFTYNGGESALDFDETASLFVHLDQSFNFVTLQVDYFDGMVVPAPNTNTTIWTGDGDWNTLQNWSQGIPTLESVAVIESGTVTIQNAVGSARTLEIKSGTTVKIMPQFSLTVADTLQNDGTLQVLSNETGTGSFIVEDVVQGSGNYTVGQFFTSGTHLAGAPVANNTTDVFGSASLKTWDEPSASFSLVASGSLLESGGGYLAEMNTNTTVSFSGNAIHQGNITLNLDAPTNENVETSGLNLISNPYPSAIEWLSGDWDLQNTENAVYVWDNYRYRVWNGYLGDLTDGIIPAMQGFFVKASGANAQITIPNNARLHSNQPFFKEAAEVENMLAIEVGKLDSGEPGAVEDVFYFQARLEATNGFDPEFDAYKLANAEGTTMVYSMQNDANFEKMAIDVRQFSGSSFPSVAIGFRPADAGTYYLRLKNVDTFDPGIPIVLQDLGLGVAFPEDEIDMRNNVSDFTYSFTTIPGDEEYRFNLHFSPVGIDEGIGYENPVKIWISDNKLVINNFSNAEEKLLLEIFDVTGRRLSQNSVSVFEEHQQDVSRLKGVFIVRLTSERMVVTKKFCK